MEPLFSLNTPMSDLLKQAAERYEELRKRGHDLSKKEDNFYEANLDMFKKMEQEILSLLSFCTYHLEDTIRFPSKAYPEIHRHDLESLHQQIGQILAGDKPVSLIEKKGCC